MFWSKNKKNRYTLAYPVLLYKMGFKGVFSARTCFPDGCPALTEAGERFFRILRSLVTSTVGSTLWSKNFRIKTIWWLVIDCQPFVDSGLLPGTEDLIPIRGKKLFMNIVL